MVVSVLYLLFRRALAVAALRFRSAEFKELESGHPAAERREPIVVLPSPGDAA